MKDLEVRVDTAPVSRFMRELFRDQIPFATARAINDTAEDVQRAERRKMAEVFTLRDRKFAERNVRIRREDRASKKRQAAAVRLETPRRSESLFAKFIRGGTKRSRDSIAEPIAIPTEHLRPSKGARVPRRMLPKNLRLVARQGVDGLMRAQQVMTRGGVIQWKGKRRTFVLDPRFHDTNTWGVFQRTGPKRHQVKLIWGYRREINIPRSFHFYEVARRTAQARFPERFRQWFDRAIRTAR